MSINEQGAGARVLGAAAGQRRIRGLSISLTSPGGCYNLGNSVGLAGGLSLAAWNASSIGAEGPATAAVHYLAGSGSGLALTVATLIFFWGGEVYHRAWADPDRPDMQLNRLGDLLSAIGAMALGLSLALVGLPLLAVTAGLLHALGKLGSALHHPKGRALPGWPTNWPDPFRSVVLLSRAPATLVAALALMAGLSGAVGVGLVPVLLGPGILLICNLIWAKADLMLFR